VPSLTLTLALLTSPPPPSSCISRPLTAVITCNQLETNRTLLSAEWNPDSPLEDLWLRITEIQRLAQASNSLIQEDTVLSLLLPVFEKTGVFTTACEKWRDFDDAV
jgi:hypothetical protein